jgi:light-regulated signal transduction histidine kinase (bacteriophytochrome)
LSVAAPAFGAADLTNCDREPIHIPGSIQPHGALLALDPATLTVAQAGGDTHWLFNVAPCDMIGKPIGTWLSPDRIGRLRELMVGDAIRRPVHALRLAAENGKDAEATTHLSDGLLLVEFEPILQENPGDILAHVQTMVRKIHQTESVEQCCAMLAEVVRDATKFDRVMIYRFESDGSGAVDAEAKDPSLSPFLGLHYPAADIPKQARELYLRNWIRVIPDTHYESAPLVPKIDARLGRPLDLSQCALRSVSPIHLEYLGNMGVTASMSLSLILDGKLWGLVACHHSTGPHFVARHLRVGLELFSQMASFLLETRVTADELSGKRKRRVVYDELLLQLAGDDPIIDSLNRMRPKLLDIIEADGVGIWFEGRFLSHGRTPKTEQVAGLVAWLNMTAPDGVFESDALPLVYPPAEEFADVASGILALSVSRTPRDYVIWFRREIIQSVVWAGNPEKSAVSEPEGVRLSPRKSFAAWRQEKRFRSSPWDRVSIGTAQTLRVNLLEIVLRRVDQVAREREDANVRISALLVALRERIAESEATALELQQESGRRAVVEADLSEVLRSTVANQEAERQRIARELHDSLGQYLAVMKLNLDGLEREVADPSDLKRSFAQLKSLTTEVGKEVDRMARELRPAVLDDIGLQAAMQQYLEERGERLGLRFELHLALGDRRLPQVIETTLYRILQEAVLNVVKHARAKKVGVILNATSAEATMIIEDDGDGFELLDGRIAPTSRLGLRGVRERLALVGGAIEIETAPGDGTTLIIHVPLDDANGQA